MDEGCCVKCSRGGFIRLVAAVGCELLLLSHLRLPLYADGLSRLCTMNLRNRLWWIEAVVLSVSRDSFMSLVMKGLW